MFKHIIFIKLKKKEDAQEIKDLLLDLSNKIPEIQTLEVGIDEFCSERSCDVVLITLFNNEDDYHIYDTHPDHEIVKRRIQELKENSYAVDFHVG